MCRQCSMVPVRNARPVELLDVVQTRGAVVSSNPKWDVPAGSRGVVTYRHRSTCRVLFRTGATGLFGDDELIRIAPAIGQ